MNHEAHEDHEDCHRYEPLPPETERIIHEVIGAAIAVHRQLGPGFIERVYDRALRVELACRCLPFEAPRSVEVRYRGVVLCRDQLDLVVANVVVVEIKAVKKLRPVHEAQLISYLKASGIRAGLLINFNVKLLVTGLRRFVR